MRKASSLNGQEACAVRMFRFVSKNGDVLDVIRHPNRERSPNQNIIVLNINGSVWLVPYVNEKGVRFLKTIIPSRKATRE